MQRRRITLDTNIYISAFIFDGVCESLLIEILDKPSVFEVVTSKYIIRELNSKMKEKLTGRDSYIEALTNHIVENTLCIELRDTPKVWTYAPDNFIIQTAIESKSELLITGDEKHLLPLKIIEGVKIIRPRDFLNTMSS